MTCAYVGASADSQRDWATSKNMLICNENMIVFNALEHVHLNTLQKFNIFNMDNTKNGCHFKEIFVTASVSDVP